MVSVEQLCREFDLTPIGDADSLKNTINSACSLENQTEDTLSWIKKSSFLPQVKAGFILVNEALEVTPIDGVTFLVTKRNTKLVFSQILKSHFAQKPSFYLKNEVDVHRENENITIADYVFIGQNVTIGKGSIIYPNVVIEANTVIGENCVIKSHVSLGTEGLGLELNPETDLLEKFPQLGNVIFEDNIEIGPNSTVRRGALKSTIVRRGTKIGSLCNIGHNCIIGENCILTCNVVTSGSSVIGNKVFLGVGSSIKNGTNVGDNVTIGQGAVVLKNIPDNETWVGNPAKKLK